MHCSVQARRLVPEALVSGDAPPGYLDACFGAAPVPTPLLPAAQMWLGALELLPASEAWRAAHLAPAADAVGALRSDIEAAVTAGGVAAWLRAAAAEGA